MSLRVLIPVATAIVLSISPAAVAAGRGAACAGYPVAAAKASVHAEPPAALVTAPALAFEGAGSDSPAGVVLAGVVLPVSAGASARTALRERLAGFSGAGLVVYAGDSRLDRRGRLDGQVTASTPDGTVWIQQALVADGLVVVADDAGACSGDLLAAEDAARASAAGLFDAAAEARVAAPGLPDFVVVEGEVLSIGKTPSTTYLNFGRNRFTDLTVRISRRISADFPAEKEPSRFAGARVRVRGWASERDGIDLALRGPDAIEILEEQRGDR
jgi:hypothetical protein